MDSFPPLAPALQGYYSLSFEQLPPEIQERLRQDFCPTPWDHLNPEQRRWWAERWDREHNPAIRSEYLAVERFMEELENLERRIALWEKTAAPTALDLAAKEQVLNSLIPKRDRLRANYRVLRGDYFGDFLEPPPDTKPRYTECSEERQRWRQCADEIQQERRQQQKPPLNKSKLALAVMERLDVWKSHDTVRKAL